MCATLIQQNIIEDYYILHRKKLINFAAARLPFPEDSEDVVQDTFLKLLEYKQMVQPETIASFIYTILRNLINDKLRSFRRHQEVETWLFETVQANSIENGEQTIDNHELMHIVRKNIQLLPENNHRIYSLYFYEGLTTEEIATRTSLDKRKVEYYLYEARKKVRKAVSEQWYEAI